MADRNGNERTFDPDDLARAYDELVIGGVFQERGDYYSRYRNRYEFLISTYAELGGGGPLDVLEVGGGQHALLAHTLFADRATVADLPGPHLDYLSSRGVTTAHWDLLTDEQPFRETFDRIFLCEVMAHVPAPPYQYLNRLRLALRPGGVLLVSTPNLHRLRNIALLQVGREPFDHFATPEPGTWQGSFFDISASQLLDGSSERSGFAHVMIERREFGHRASSPSRAPRQPRVAAAHADPPLAVLPRRHRHPVAFVTPSYRLDRERCALLNRSLEACATVVRALDRRRPRRPPACSAPSQSNRTNCRGQGGGAPPLWVRRVDTLRLGLRSNVWLQARGRPIRGWLLQQLVKLAVAESLSTDVLVHADSDVVSDPSVLGRCGRPRRRSGPAVRGVPDYVDEAHARPRPLASVGRENLLGVGPADIPMPDYISTSRPLEASERRSRCSGHLERHDGEALASSAGCRLGRLRVHALRSVRTGRAWRERGPVRLVVVPLSRLLQTRAAHRCLS